MAKIKNFSQTFEVQSTSPLDDRLVVNSVDELYTIKYPYVGMTVAVAGSSDLWVFLGMPGEQSDSTKWKRVGGTISDYSIPLMTSDMVDKALADPSSGFTSETNYIEVDEGSTLTGTTKNNYATVSNGTYVDILFSAIRELQAEVNRLKNSFKYGINSYQESDTALSAISGGDMGDTSEDEPIWAIDPDEVSELTEIKRINEDGLARFSKNSTKNNVYFTTQSSQDKITITSDGSIFKLSESEVTSIKSVTDAKLIIYFQLACNKISDVTLSNPQINIQLKSLENSNSDDTDDTITFSPFNYMIDIAQVPEYCVMVVISRKQKNSDSTLSGKNYVYLSVSDKRTDEVLLRGYWNRVTDKIVSKINSTIEERYYWDGVYFKDLTLTDCRFCSKYQDFSNEVIPANPDSKNDFKYEAAHITIRAISTKAKAIELKDQLQENELIWIKEESIMLIKSDNRLRVVTSGNSSINSDSDSENNDIDYMTTQELINKLLEMGIIVSTKPDGSDSDSNPEFDVLKLNDVSDITFINQDTDKKYKFAVDAYGKLQSTEVLDDDLQSLIDEYNIELDVNIANYSAYRGLIADVRKGTKSLNGTTDFGDDSDRLRISGFFAPLTSATKCGCSHSFVELENSSTRDIPLTGVILYHKYFNGSTWTYRKLELDGVCKAGSTYLIRGAQHADLNSPSTFIKVTEFDKEWYEDVNGVKQLVSFELDNTITTENSSSLSGNIHSFMLTYGEQSGLTVDTIMITENADSNTKENFPIIIKSPRYIDGCAYYAAKINNPDGLTVTSSKGAVSNMTEMPHKTDDTWARSYTYPIPLKENTMFRLMFKLDPAKQAFNGFNVKDGSRERYKNKNDVFVVNLDSPKLTFKTSPYEYPVENYTPHASSYNATVMTDKSRLDFDKPNMVNVAYGIDVYNTRCFSWVSVGAFDEYVWIKKQTDSSWNRFESYKSGDSTEEHNGITKKTFNSVLKTAAYDRINDIFPGDNTPFTAHKCILTFPDASNKTVYEYRVGRGSGFGNNTLDEDHCSEVRTFTLYPRTWEGRVYQITDQQGFHWVEYQVWAGAAKALLTKIASDNLDSTNEFPILLNTGDMTQSGARINEWLDYHIAGDCLFNHLEQMNVVGNNDLNDINPDVLGTGNDSGKSVSRFFHYFYCHEVPNDESLVMGPDLKYIPSIYYFKTNKMMYLCFNSEMTTTTSQQWLKINYDEDYKKKTITLNPYTGIVVLTNSTSDNGKTITSNCQNAYCDSTKMTQLHFTPIYKTIYNWLLSNQLASTPKSVVFACHEIPFTVITVDSLQTLQSELNGGNGYTKSTRNYPSGSSLLGSHANQMNVNETSGTYWLSRLFEHFGVRIAIGGHKHTYAISWPLQEYYFYSKKTELNVILQYQGDGQYSFIPYEIPDESDEYLNRIIDITVKSGETFTDTSSKSYTIPSSGEYTTAQISALYQATFDKNCGGSIGDALTYFENNSMHTLKGYNYIRLSLYDSSTLDSSKPNGTYHSISQGQGQMPMTWNQMENESTSIMVNGNIGNNYNAGTPVVKVTWEVKVNSDSTHNGISLQGDRYCLENQNSGNEFIINTTKLPLMVRNTSIFGTESSELSDGNKAGFNNYLYRCATPITGVTLENPVVYFMLQATGYKITSNKELPSAYQYFSQILPQTAVKTTEVKPETGSPYVTFASGDPSFNQCYPMFAMLKVGSDSSGATKLDLYMTRVKGIVVTTAKAITFTQGTKPQQNKVSYEYLIPNSSSIYGTWGQTVYTDTSATGGVGESNLTVGTSTSISSTTGSDNSGEHVDYTNSKIKMSTVVYKKYETIS